MKSLTKDMKLGIITGIMLILALIFVGLFAWWAFTWSTHTLVWAIFIFGSILGSVKVRS